MRKIDEIIIHCSATAEGKDFNAADIDRWHKQRGFKKIGYHYVIKLDGTIEKGRGVEEIGAHCLNHNKNSIGICYIGGLSSDGKTPKDTRTTEQKKALWKLIVELLIKYPNATIHGHRTYAAKACPCFNAEEEYQCIKF